jgi:hypothetical protein
MNDITLATKYLAKAQSAAHRGIEFNLSLLSFRNLMRAGTCRYTGLELNDNTRTVDRIDNTLGYVSGNVAAVHTIANSIKSMWENPNNPLTPELVKKILENL